MADLPRAHTPGREKVRPELERFTESPSPPPQFTPVNLARKPPSTTLAPKKSKKNNELKLSKARIPMFQRREYNRDIWRTKKLYNDQKAAYKKKWAHSPLFDDEGNARPAAEITNMDKLLDKFFGNKGKDHDPLPRCWTCRKGGAAMPEDDLVPDGSEQEELAPCGCSFAAACLEYYYAVCGPLFEYAVVRYENVSPGYTKAPKTYGAHAYMMLLQWEMFFGPWTMRKMLGLGNDRINGAQEMLDARRNVEGGMLAPFYVVPAKQRKARSPKKRSGNRGDPEIVDDEDADDGMDEDA